MQVSVAICTWNRADLLHQTLCEFRKLQVPDDVQWELLVINNNCTDDTDKVIARHSEHLPLRRLFEEMPGLSNARNCAVAAARGDLILWTDDDVLVDPHWLAEYVRAAKAWPQASYFGGRVDPWYETDPPEWFRKHERALLPLRSLSKEERILERDEQIFGANMGFRLAALKKYGFDPNLGRIVDKFMLGEESAVMNRMRDDGHVGVWIPSAILKHFVPRSRMERKNVWQYMQGSGRTMVRMKEIDPSGRQLFGAPRWLYPQYVKALAVYAWQWATRNDDPFPAIQRAALLEGWIAEFRHQSRLARAKGDVRQPSSQKGDSQKV